MCAKSRDLLKRGSLRLTHNVKAPITVVATKHNPAAIAARDWKGIDYGENYLRRLAELCQTLE